MPPIDDARALGVYVGKRFAADVAAGVYDRAQAEDGYIDYILASHGEGAADEDPEHRWERKRSEGFLKGAQIDRASAQARGVILAVLNGGGQ